MKCIVITSREQRFITKERIAMHTNLIIWFNLLDTFYKKYRILSGNIDIDFNLADRFTIVKLNFYSLPLASYVAI